MEDEAFGGNPGAWPLPAAASAEDLWLRAVAAGGLGRYSSALTDLAAVRRLAPRGRLASLACSTHASFLRQLGWHDQARSLDGQAWALSGGSGEAAADALIGLAADALGVGRFAASARALDRASALVAASGVARLPVRLAWVSAELAMVRADGASAVAHAERAVRLAESLGSVRHAAKSAIILAAAHASSGDTDAARVEAGAALTQTQRHGLVPLQWAAACLLADLPSPGGGGEPSQAEITAIRDRAAESVTRWGGVWRSR
ncbi:hypothetical protein Mycch_1110 [Mycolicibacterium chubuense NBB4]|uniref:Uncharacterized protein n=1 Tax=Mycolicibacterium chubuense (strain NBB4) TaxID=710421 RepID=I4BF61_MYCCN|nr:hypothetical protein [Mycolicibacterium chubuense]AFM15918.1 hypothetical protein Mycch_1110 [Mycolicibacterium chubuense NBB4]